ncbi:DUF6049 family protein [Lacisediminihabitans sp. FW035]
MRLVTSLFAVALAIGAIIAPGLTPGGALAVAPSVVQAADDAKAVLTFAPASNGVLSPGQDLVISGTVANPTTKSISAGSAAVVLNRTPVRTRSELASWLAPAATSSDDSLGTTVLTAATPEVPAGRTVPMQFTVPAASIDFGSQGSAWGTRTLAVRLTAAGSEIGQARSSIVWNPGTGVQSTRIALVIPLTVPQSTDGLIPSDLLAGYTADGGLLSRQLDAVFDQPGIAIAVDPRVLASIRILGDSVPPSAFAWLRRLEAATNDTFALSYADSDLSAASQAKAPRLLAPTSFPIDPSLFPDAPTSAPTDQPSSSPTPRPTGGTTIAPVPDLTSLQAFDYTVPAVAWPARDSVVEADLDSFETGGLTTTILGSGNVGYGDLDYTPSSAALVGKHKALVSDDALSADLNAAVQASTPAQWEKAMSELSSLIAVISLERPAAARTMLATFDRSRPGADSRLAQTLAALAALPWAGSASLSEADAAFGSGSAVLPATATLTAKPESADRIATVTALLAAEATAGSFSSVLTDPTQITGERRLSLLALLSNSWTGDDTWVAETKKYLAKSNRYVTKSVTIARSSATVFTSRNSPLPITVTNELPWPVTVYVTVRSPSNIITIDNDRVELVVEAQSQAKTTVPVTSNANGPVTLTVSLSSATNVQITTPATIDVDVQAQWETAFTAVVAVLVFGVFGFGIYRTVAKRRKAKRADARDSGDPTPDAPSAP